MKKFFKSNFDGTINQIKKKEKRKAFIYSLSGIVPGLGQTLNGQWYKAVPLWILLIIITILELVTSRYVFAASELANPMYGAANYKLIMSFFHIGKLDEVIYFWRDYGGFITKGLWGLFTLGTVGRPEGGHFYKYRGFSIAVEIQDGLPWTRFDDSSYLLGFGLMAFVVIMILLGVYIYSIVDSYKTRYKITMKEPLPTIKEYYKQLYENLFAYLVLIPSILLMLVFTLIPLLFSALVAFTNYTRTVSLVKWTGFNAFTSIINDKNLLGYFTGTFIWTIVWAIATSFTVYVMGFINALVIESKYISGIKVGKFNLFGKKFFRTIFILPWAIPGMISLMAYKSVFDVDGPANKILSLLKIGNSTASLLHQIGLAGIDRFPISWFSVPANGMLARVVVILVNLWLGWPYHMMLITGVLATISSELYEAASIDGASSYQKFKHITLPSVITATMPSIIMTFSFNFNNFGAIYYLTGGGPGYEVSSIGAPGQTDILISWIYKLTFNGDTGIYNRGAVYSILIFLLVGVFSVWNMSRTKLMKEED